MRTYPSVLALMIVLAITGCDEPPDATNAEPDTAPAATAADTPKPGPCALLTEQEVAAVIGPLAGPPYRANGLQADAAGDLCRYEAQDLRSIVVSVAWEDGARQIGMLNLVQGIVSGGEAGKLTLIDGTVLAGEWDEARIAGCCEFVALRGDQVVTLDFTGTRADLTQATGLVDAAIRRLEQPLTVDDAAAVAAAQTREVARPRPRSVCELVTRAEAEIIAGAALVAEPVGDASRCLYRIPLDMADSSHDIDLNVQWRDGFREMRIMQAAFGQSIDMLGLHDAPSDQEPGPWDAYAQSMVGILAVKRDVLVSIESGPFKQEVARAFIAKAIENLDR